MIKNLIIFGTRPEAIKMAPLVKEFQKQEMIDIKGVLNQADFKNYWKL